MNNPTRQPEKKHGNGSKKRRPSLKERSILLLNVVRPHAVYLTVIIAAIATIDLMIRPMSTLDMSGFQIGQPSPRVVSAPLDFDYIDEITTKIQQTKAEGLVSPIYRMQPENLETMKQSIHKLAEAIRNTPIGDNENADEWVKGILEATGFSLENRLFNFPEDIHTNSAIPKTLYESIIYYKGYETLWKAIESHIDTAAGRGIAEDVSPLNLEDPRKTPNITTQRLSIPVTLIKPDGSSFVAPPQEIRTQLQFIDQFKQLIATEFPDPVKDIAARELANDIIQAAYSSAGPTLVYEKQQTEKLKEKARSETPQERVTVKKDEILIGKNVLVTELHLQALEELRSQTKISSLAEMGYLILSLLFVFIILQYMQSYHPDVAKDTRKVTVIFVGILLIFALTRVAIYLSLLDLGSHKLANVAYAVPLGALGVILTLLVQSRLALFCCALSSIYMGIILNGGLHQFALPYVLVSFVTSCGAIYTVSHIRQRSDLYRAGGVAIFLASALIFALSLGQHKFFEQLLKHTDEVKWALIWGSVNGGLISILAMALLPIFEDFYGVVTDMKLLELSQKNEIMQRLEQEAPGSYQHSMRVATLAETAAESIGANALLTRVGCYYHDMGKIVKPQYFVENQQTVAEKAKHSKLTTNMSCFLIRSHVKHGIELAQKYKLPKVIADFIPEHHGTTLMSYFYHQALEEAGTEGTVKEADFRYPGPKPQSKETAIAMLSDALEAASRTLETGNERDVRQLVRKIINERFMDGQFDECNLTLKDLHQLFLTFSESILSMMHQRIVYPTGFPSRDKESESDKSTAEADLRIAESGESANPENGEEKSEKNSMLREKERPKEKQAALKLE